MIVFSTKLPLKKIIDYKCVFNVIKEWLMESPHYNISDIKYDFEEELEINTSSNTKLKLLNISVEENKIFAIRFENQEERAIWRTDCVFTESTHELLIQLSCENKYYATKLPKTHKPHIIKLLFEKNMVAETEIYPITDKPIVLSIESDIEKCTQIMLGNSSTYLPVVYLSYNSFLPLKYAIDPEKIAIKLAGIAHVLVEPNIEFSKKIKTTSNGNNAYNGFIGVYFPGTKYRDFISYNAQDKNQANYYKSIANAVHFAVQQAALNHSNVDDWSWDKIALENAKQRFIMQAHMTSDAKKEFDEYVLAFDIENQRLKEKIKSLNDQLDSKTAQLESLKAKNDQDVMIRLKCNIQEFYMDECYDFVLNVLMRTKAKLATGTRPYEIMEDILKSNKFSNKGKAIFKDIETALSEDSLKKRRSDLQKCGFKVEVGSHDKITFHDNKYMFTLSNSPSDYRNDENTYKEIMKSLNIYLKYE